MGSGAWAQIGPLSRPAVSRMIVTPVPASPAMIARSTGAAPRQRGNNDGWTLKITWSLSSGSLISAPNAHRHIASGRTAPIRATASSELTLSGW